MVTDFEAHLERLYACNACPNVVGRPVTGGVAGARMILVGQAPGPHEMDEGRPFAYTAGNRLFGWFRDRLGVGEADFRARVHIAAVIRCFPGKDARSGGDRVPDVGEIERCRVYLDQELRILGPTLVIAVGTLASNALTGIAQLKEAAGVLHHTERAGRRFDVIVLPHPSGRSTWLNKPENAALLEQSLTLIAGHAAWRKTFPR